MTRAMGTLGRWYRRFVVSRCFANCTAVTLQARLRMQVSWRMHESWRSVSSLFWLHGDTSGGAAGYPANFATATDAEIAHDAGLCQLSSLSSLQDLSLTESFTTCTHNGLNAALATLTGAAWCNCM